MVLNGVFVASHRETHFGYQSVAENDKADRVGEVFDSVANAYDLMNDAMSLGVHRLWKRHAIASLQLRMGHRVLDLAAGTGDLTRLALPLVGDSGVVLMTDINHSMLSCGRDRFLDQGLCSGIEFLRVDAEVLPFENHSFDRIMMGFGLRNVTHKDRVLSEMYRVLRPGGIAMVLEFSHPTQAAFAKLYDWYSFNILPTLGSFLAKDRDSYQYLVESIRMHPKQDTLQQMFTEAGFDHCHYHNLTQGIVAIHKGVKY